jgi:cytochrome c biogenesis protein CcmG/thiol:disulfide interchange protein DsbE
MRPSARGRLVGAALVLIVATGLVACSQRKVDPAAEHARLDFALKNTKGVDVSLATFKGSPLVINFWATYCVPCKAEIPILNALVDEHRARRLSVVGISYDDVPPDIVKFAETTPMHYPLLVGLGHDDLMEAYEAQIALPTTWVIRADGTVVAKHIGAETREWFEAQVRAAF